MAKMDGHIHKKLIDFVNGNHNIAEKYRSGLTSEWLEYIRLWLVKPRDTAEEYGIAFPDIYQATETINARLMAMLFGHHPFFEYEAIDTYGQSSQIDPDEAAELATLSVSRDLAHHTVNFYKQYEKFTRQLLQLGLSVGKIRWQHIEQDITRYSTFSQMPERQVLYDGPVFRAVSIFNWFPAPGSADFDSIDWEVEVFSMNKHQLEVLGAGPNPHFHDIDRVRTKEKKGTDDSGDQTAAQTTPEIEEIRGLLGLSTPPEEGLKLKEYWGPAPFNFKTPDTRDFPGVEVERGKWCVLTVANGKEDVLVRADDSPFADGDSPYISTGLVEQLGDILFSVGAIAPSQSMMYQLNQLAAQQLDMIALLMNRPLLMEEESFLNPNAIVMGPGEKWILQSGMKGTVEALDMGSVHPDTFMAVKDLASRIEAATGARQFFQGGATSTQVDRTATGIQSVMAAGNERFENYARLMEKGSLSEILMKVYRRKQAFMTNVERVRRMTSDGQEMLEVTPEHFYPEVNARPIAFSEMQNRDQRRGWILNFLQMAANPVMLQILAAQGMTVNIPKLLKRAYQMGGFQDTADVIIPLNEMREQVMALLQGGQGGGNGAVQPGTGSGGTQIPDAQSAESMIRGLQQEERQMSEG